MWILFNAKIHIYSFNTIVIRKINVKGNSTINR